MNKANSALDTLLQIDLIKSVKIHSDTFFIRTHNGHCFDVSADLIEGTPAQDIEWLIKQLVKSDID